MRYLLTIADGEYIRIRRKPKLAFLLSPQSVHQRMLNKIFNCSAFVNFR